MEAIKLETDGAAQVDRDRCIGCGLCVTTCPSESLSLQSKSESERQVAPPTARDFIMQLTLARGKSLVPLVVSQKSQT